MTKFYILKSIPGLCPGTSTLGELLVEASSEQEARELAHKKRFGSWLLPKFITCEQLELTNEPHVVKDSFKGYMNGK